MFTVENFNFQQFVTDIYFNQILECIQAEKFLLLTEYPIS